VYLPFQRGKWKDSTSGTSENRIQAHIVMELGNDQLRGFTPTGLQGFLERKGPKLSFSVVDHLRWDLTSICEMAVAEGVLPTNPATRLYTPKSAKKGDCPSMTVDDVETALGAVEVREKLILHLAILSGLRPGEILAIQRRHVAGDGSSVQIEQRVYRGKLDCPKNGETRIVAVAPRTATLLCEWLGRAVDAEPNSWVFASETNDNPLWRDNLLRRNIRPALENEPDSRFLLFSYSRVRNSS
jgi:integrase